MRDLMVCAVSHQDRLLQHSDEAARLFLEPSAAGLLPTDDQVVADIAAGTAELRLQCAMKCRLWQLADGLRSRTNCGDGQFCTHFNRILPEGFICDPRYCPRGRAPTCCVWSRARGCETGTTDRIRRTATDRFQNESEHFVAGILCGGRAWQIYCCILDRSLLCFVPWLLFPLKQ